jgi:glycosyltransferase involved in cell wall biosynthesis
MKKHIPDINFKINIIILGNFLYPAGMAATRRKQQFIDYFKKQGAEVKVLVLYQGSNKYRPSEDCEGWHKGVYYRIIGNRMGKSLKLLYQFPVFLFQACKLLAKWKMRNTRNIILSFGFDGFVIIPFLWARIKGYRIYFDMVEDFSLYPLKTLKLRLYFYTARLINKLFLRGLVHGISVISKHLEKKYKEEFRGPVVMVPISATVRQISVKEKYGKPITFMYAGSFSNKDGIDIMLSAFEEVHAKYADTMLVLSGRGDNKRIQKLSSRVNDSPIRFVGLLPDEEYFESLNIADVLLMTRVESGFANAGFPYKLGEYLATGNVVISTKTSDIEFYLQDKKNALLIKPENKNELVKAMKYCIENEETCIKIGKNGQKTCIRYFNPEQNSKALLSLMLCN